MKFSTKFTLIPADYKAPVSSDIFLKMAKAGAPIKFVIVGTTVPGFSYWTNDKKCIRSREKPLVTPDIQVEESGKVTRISHFWVIPVFDCATETIKLLEITQQSLQGQLKEIFEGGDYNLGDLSVPMAIRISAVGEKLTTKYTLMPVPYQGENLMTKLQSLDTDIDVDEIVFGSHAEVPPAVKPEAPTPTMPTQAATDMM